MTHPFKQHEEIQEKDLGKFISDFEKFQSSASLKRQHRTEPPQGRSTDLSRDKILNLDKNKLVFLIYWQNVKMVARKFRNAYFYELSQRSLTSLQAEALSDLADSKEILSLHEQINVINDGLI